MQRQNEIIDLFRKKFPKLTLEKTSQKLKINRTRLFRIYNGSEMKLQEFEAFEKVLYADRNHKAQDFLQTAKTCLGLLSEEKLLELLAEMKDNLEGTKYTIQGAGL